MFSTSFPGFSPTRPTELRRAGRREPWERNWHVLNKLKECLKQKTFR